MARIRDVLFVGIYNSVVALDPRDGSELWRSKLGGGTLLNVHWDGTDLFASTKGEVFRLDPRDGQVVWHNKLKGLGTGFVTLASNRAATSATQQVIGAAKAAADAAHAAGAA